MGGRETTYRDSRFIFVYTQLKKKEFKQTVLAYVPCRVIHCCLTYSDVLRISYICYFNTHASNAARRRRLI